MKNPINPNQLREKVLDMVYNAKSGHIGGSFSLAELCSYLYSNYSLVSPKDLNSDVLILSKGHAVPIIYASLNLLGKISDEELKTFREIDSRLQGHPHCLDIPELHASTGSLGQGISIAIGRAIAKKKLGNKGRVFCILGDGEMQEGQVWEALMFLGNQVDLDNISIILDDNKFQNDKATSETMSLGDIKMKIESFNLKYIKVNGQSIPDLHDAFTQSKDKVSFIHLETSKGAGIKFMEGLDWHARIPNDEEYNNAISILKSK
tara:strand:- start:373 stop:1161 length:789 start_codon:yes stop_codon:yes gene_type:complete